MPLIHIPMRPAVIAQHFRDLEDAAYAAWFRKRYGIPPIRGASVNAAYGLVNAPFAATAGAKTVLNAIAPAGHGLALTEFILSADGVTSSAVPLTLDVCQSTQATAGTSAGAATITQVRGRATGGSAPTSGTNYTAEPTALTAIKKLYVPQFNGLLIYQFPLGREVESDSSGGTVKALALRANVSANVNLLASMEVEAVG